MNDDEKLALTPANENPWYWLATLYGEQKGSWSHYDLDLAVKNRTAWNRWIADALTDGQRASLMIQNGFDALELTPLSNEERTDFLKQFTARAGREYARPPATNVANIAGFINVHFEHLVALNSFVFPFFAGFGNAVFSGGAIFSNAAFSNGADFANAAFSDYADFSNAAFSGHAGFSHTAFSRNADFREAAFFGYAGFSEAAFSDYADFRRAAFSAVADFREAAFSSIADFKATEFKSRTVFADAKFQTSVPDFRDAKLREATEWHGAEWPPPPKERNDAQQQVYAYERLKAEMERLKKHEDEQFFFGKELRARRALLWFQARDKERLFGERVNDAVAWLLNRAYDLLGSYGLSIGRPIFWLFALLAAGAIAFATTNSLDDGPMDLQDAAALSATNLISLLPYKPDKSITDHLSTTAKIIGDLQSFLGLVLLFLLGLALRNRFRMK